VEAAAPAAAKPAHEHHGSGSGKRGKLSLDTNPWTEVFWKGKSLGQTPLLEVDFPAGPQQLQLRNPGESVDQTIEVVIKPGEVTTKKLHLQ
jgi:serine/threonine-protein kinase